MKKQLTCLFASAIALAGCSSPLDKPYAGKTFSEDLKSLVASGKIDQGLAMALTFYAAGADLRHENLEGKSYKSLLDEMKTAQTQAAEKAAQEKALAEKVAAADNEILQELQRTVRVRPYDREFVKKNDEHYAGIKYSIQNLSGRSIKGFQGQFIFSDMFGSIVKKYVVSEQELLAAGASTRTETYWKIKPYDDEDQHFAEADFKKLTCEWRPLRVLFDDGKKIEAADAAKIQ